MVANGLAFVTSLWKEQDQAEAGLAGMEDALIAAMTRNPGDDLLVGMLDQVLAASKALAGLRDLLGVMEGRDLAR